jgi:ribosome-binding factor A
MKTRRQEKVARVVKEAVSDCLASHLSDPRIEGLVSVTKVDVTTDLRNAEVFISVLGRDETSQNKTFNAITHASRRIQSFLAHRMQSRFCPVLHFKYDENFKKTLETMRLIDQAVGEFDKKSQDDIDDSDAITEEESYDKD